MSQPKRDYGFLAIMTLVAINAVWLLLMPWVPTIASATLHRFHLRSSSFGAWAIQFPIPSMYNFANHFEVSKFPPGMVDPILADPLESGPADPLTRSRYINHFPFRIITFANTRYRFLHDGRDRWVTLESTYRGQSIETQIHCQADGNGGFQVIPLDAPENER